MEEYKLHEDEIELNSDIDVEKAFNDYKNAEQRMINDYPDMKYIEEQSET